MFFPALPIFTCLFACLYFTLILPKTYLYLPPHFITPKLKIFSEVYVPIEDGFEQLLMNEKRLGGWYIPTSTLGVMVVITDNASAVAVLCLLYIVCLFLLHVCIFCCLVSSILCLFVYCYFMFYCKKLLFIDYHFSMLMMGLLRYSNMFLLFYFRICFSFFFVWITFYVFM